MSVKKLVSSLARMRALRVYRRQRYLINRGMGRKAAAVKWKHLVAAADAEIKTLQGRIAVLQTGPRDRIVAVAKQAKANYDSNPRAYHYLAGGVPNTIILSPTPRGYRSDCSQFAVNVYRHAGLACPGTGSFMYSNTVSIAQGGRVVSTPKPGDLGLYGSRWSPHHVEVYIGNGAFIGHGTQKIDSMTPGAPSFYLSFIND